MFRFAATAALVIALLSPAAAQEKRVALVIGNADYRNVVSIKNPVNDAIDVSQSLRRIGFAVTTLVNSTAQDMRQALVTFGNKASLSDVAVLHYSGHGLQADGVVWLLPVDGQARSLAEIAQTAINLPQILEQIDGARKLTAVFLDTARNDPFNEAAKGNLPAGLLKQAEDPANVLISFATGAGRTVADGEDRNSPFTAALLKHLEEPGLELTRLMKQVRNDVAKATANQQVPAFYMTAADDIYFVPPAVKAPEPERAAQSAGSPEKPVEAAASPDREAEAARAEAVSAAAENPAPANDARDAEKATAE